MAGATTITVSTYESERESEEMRKENCNIQFHRFLFSFIEGICRMPVCVCVNKHMRMEDVRWNELK
jgi:hypothetical protein